MGPAGWEDPGLALRETKIMRSTLGADVPAFKVRWRGYDRAEVEEYLGDITQVSTGSGQATGQAQATRQEDERLIGLRRDLANCLLEISATAKRDGRTLLADDTPSDGEGPGDVEAGLRAPLPTGDVDRADPGELLRAARQEVERLVCVRRNVANRLLEIGTAAEREGRALLAVGHDEPDAEMRPGQQRRDVVMPSLSPVATTAPAVEHGHLLAITLDLFPSEKS